MPVNGTFGVVFNVCWLTVIVITVHPPVSLPYIVNVVVFAEAIAPLALTLNTLPDNVTAYPLSISEIGGGP